MTTPMLEKMAQAIRLVMIPELIPGHRIPWADVNPRNKERLILAAQAALEALTDPDGAMLAAAPPYYISTELAPGITVDAPFFGFTTKAVFIAVIQAAMGKGA